MSEPGGTGPERDRDEIDRRFEQMVSSWRTGEPADEAEEHFVPGPTEPLPAGDLHFWSILLGLTAGPLLLLLSAGLSLLPAVPWALLGTASSVAGFVLLVLRSPRRRGEDDGSGARV
ncbi:MAG TPA: hypothetical protein VJ976_06890 [Ornithinimicrobium sp.]|uniref:hypothetical protein n=1 Tax=Ornithinimicrobium sp. TaxID=1977084 RepID=UPI002B493F1F|nr:hypothetical protein [Ornithinimicrobium sp.]HKJ12101.1 hypothetical protein [Ornithinimicrobium sp.]